MSKRLVNNKSNEAIASQSAVAIENDKLHKKMVARSRNLEALVQMGRMVTSSLNLNETVRQIINYSTVLIDVPVSILLLLDKERSVFKIMASEGLPEYYHSMEIKKSEKLFGKFDKPGIKFIDDFKEFSDIPLFEFLAQDFTDALLLPLIIEDLLQGILIFFDKKSLLPHEEELSSLSIFANQGSVAIKNALAYESEQNIAKLLQEALIKVPEQIPGIEFGHIYRSSTVKPGFVGGDFYDIFEYDHDKIGIIVGDISGKGIEAATVTALVKNTIKAFAYQQESPAAVIEKTNEVVRKSTPSGLFATVFFGVLDKITRELVYCSAGHPPGIIKSRKNKISMLDAGSPLIGEFSDITFLDEKMSLERGDVLIVYTDGVIDARSDSEFFGEKRLTDLIKELKGINLKNLPDKIYKNIASFSNGQLADDIVIIAVSCC